MGIDTKGVVVTPCKDVMLVCDLAESALNNFINDERNIRFPGVWAGKKKVRDAFQDVTTTLRPAAGMARLHFKFEGESRMLTMFFTCDCDHLDLSPKSISMSMGCYGRSDEIMQTVLHALSLLGPAHFDHNDCDDVEMAPLKEYRPTLMQAVALGYVRHTDVEDWVAHYRNLAAKPTKADREVFFGCSHEQLQSLLTMPDYKESWAAVKAFAASVHTPELNFRADFHEEMAIRENLRKPEVAPA